MRIDPIVRAGVVLGAGLGGFLDGIVLHQILGWHHLVCVTAHCEPRSIEHLQQQNTQDGWFHLAVWIVTLLGVILLARARAGLGDEDSTARLTGGMLGGWGAFNLIEGLIDHQILAIHHVLPGHPQQFTADMLFLGFGAALLVFGWRIARPRRAS